MGAEGGTREVIDNTGDFEPCLSFGRFVLDRVNEQLTGPDGPIRIGRKAYGTLNMLLERPGMLVTKDSLFERVWDGAIVSESALTSVIKELRRALGDEVKTPQFIESIYGRGYRFLAAVETIAPPEPRPQSPEPRPAPSSPSVQPVRVGLNWRWVGFSAAGTASLALAVLAVLHARSAPVPLTSGSATAELRNFEKLTPEVPDTLVKAIRAETLAALGQDGAVQVRPSGSETSPGSFTIGGSVRRTGGQLRVAVEVTSGDARTQLWSQLFEFADTRKDDVPRSVGSAIGRFSRCFAASDRGTLDAHAITLLAQFCGAEADADPAASRVFRSARALTEAAPDFSRGWSALAAAGTARLWRGDSAPEQLRRDALAAADAALRLNADNGEALVQRALLAPRSHMTERAALYRRAVATMPLACGCENLAYGDFMIEAGLINTALDQYAQAAAIQPLLPDAHLRYAYVLTLSGDTAGAASQLRIAGALGADSGEIERTELRGAIAARNFAAAVAVLARTPSGIPASERSALQAALAASGGSAQRRAQAVEALLADLASRPRASVEEIAALAALGADTAALAQLLRLAGGPPHQIGDLLFSPVMESVRRLPGFAGLVERLGLTAYWHETRQKPDFCIALNAPAVCSSL